MKKLLKVPFLCLLVLTAAVAAPFVWQEIGLLPRLPSLQAFAPMPELREPELPAVPETPAPPETPPAAEPPVAPETPETPQPSPPVSRPNQPHKEPSRPGMEEALEEASKPKKPEDPFLNALFIGDSRTVGIRKYAGIEGADFFATTGMSVYQMFSDKTDVGDLTKIDLATLLGQKTYDRIFIMLGINELGYNFDRTVQTFGQAVETLRALQPQAYIHVQANLHVSKAKSDGDKLYNNDNINRLNAALAGLADGEQVFFLDVNPAFDDENGCLQGDLTWDGVHLLSKHYSIWADWLRENTPA